MILQVLDARDPLGTRCESVEKYLAKEKRTKKVIYILNKVDLVPGWVAVSSPFFSVLPLLPPREGTPRMASQFARVRVETSLLGMSRLSVLVAERTLQACKSNAMAQSRVQLQAKGAQYASSGV